jgi:hypothetical protein
LLCDLSASEIEAVFNFSNAERRVVKDRRGPALKLALALQIGFLRMTCGSVISPRNKILIGASAGRMS